MGTVEVEPSPRPPPPFGSTKELIKNLRDNQQLLSIFPEELWIVVIKQFKDLNDPSVLENLSNASPFFRNLLLSERTQFLFPKVLDILDAKYHRKQTTDNITKGIYVPDGRYCSYNGTVYKKCRNCDKWNVRWWYSTILIFRQVCRSWDTAVDNFFFFGQIPSKYSDSLNPEDGKVCQARFDLTIPDFVPGGNVSQLPSLLEHFRTTHSQKSARSPFATKNVTVRLKCSNNRLQDILRNLNLKAYPPCLTILTNYGHHIWNCNLVLKDETLPPFYQKLRTVLKAMPNLKSLNVILAGSLGHPPRELEELERVIALNPLPRLIGLRILALSKFPGPILNELIRRNSQINVLDFLEGLHRETCALDVIPLPNLEQFYLRLQFSPDFQKLEISKMHLSPLQKVNLDFQDFEGDFIEWSRIFQVLEKWAETLKIVELTLPHAKGRQDRDRIVRESTSLKLNLPHVVNLKLEINNLTTLDFMIPMMNSLEFLDLNIRYHESKQEKEKAVHEMESEQVIQFLNCYERPLVETNIWKIFGKLKRIQFKETMPIKSLKLWKREVQYDIHEAVYTRNEWEKEMEKKEKMRKRN